MTNTRIVNVGDAIYSAHRKARFDPKHFLLAYDQTVDLKIRAQLANVSGEERVFVDSRRRLSAAHGMGAYYLECVKEEVAINRFLNPVSSRERDHSRPGIRDEYVALIALYPQHARRHRLVCINSELFYGDMYMTLAAFEWKEGHFEVRLLPEEPRTLCPGDAVIFRK